MTNTNTATISWTTDVGGSSQVEYSTDLSYNLKSPFSTVRDTSHTVILTGLPPSTSYHYRVRSRNAAGTEFVSTDHLFQTPSPPAGVHNVTIVWTTDEASSSQVEYGTTTAYGTRSPYDPARVTSHSVTLLSLAPGLYHYRVRDRNAAGTELVGADQTFLVTGAMRVLVVA